MSGGAISLEKSVRTCSVNVGEANRIQSDRFFNPNLMVCVPWTGLDNTGREVSPDSFYTKTPGCDSAEDRVMVENSLRPSYYSYVTLGAQGVQGQLYGNTDAQVNTASRYNFDKSRDKITGNFGLSWGSEIQNNSCTINAYERSQAMMNQNLRGQNFMDNGYKAWNYQQASNNAY